MAHFLLHPPSFNSCQSLAPNYLCLAHLESSLRMQLIGRSQDWLREEFAPDGYIHVCDMHRGKNYDGQPGRLVRGKSMGTNRSLEYRWVVPEYTEGRILEEMNQAIWVL